MEEKKSIIPHDQREDAIVVALIGQPNVGKSTIYNALSGAVQHIGNWPGKTVEVSWSKIRFNSRKIILVDLPGTYTLTGYTEEEEVTINFLLKEKPDVVVVITDVSALPRNMYLLLQVLEMTNRVVLVVNMMDEADRWGINVDLRKLSATFGIPVVGTVAIRNVGLKSMLKEAIKVAESPPKPKKLRYGSLEEYIEQLEKILSEKGVEKPRYVAIRILEGDTKILSKLDEDTISQIRKVLEDIRRKYKRDPRMVITSERYKLIDEILLETFSKKRWTDKFTEAFDRFFFKPGIDIGLSFLILFGTFFIAYQIGAIITDWFASILDEYLLGLIGEFVRSNMQNEWLAGLVVDGIIGGFVFALTFLPLIFIFSFTLAFIENLGVLARISLAIDRLFAKFDVSGKAFFPLMTGLACNVISVTSTRILPSKKEKLKIMIVSQFIQCPPRQVIIALLLNLLFDPLTASILFGAYIIFGFVLALGIARIMKIFEGSARYEVPIELPPYRLPSVRVLLRISWNRAVVFVERAGVLIVVANIVFWLLASIPPDATIESSVLGIVGKALAIFIYPMGLSWKEALALFSGIIAKEITLGVLQLLYGDLSQISLGIPAMLAFITIYAYYVPCIATVSSIKAESGSWLYALKAILISIAVALLLGLIVYVAASFIIGMVS